VCIHVVLKVFKEIWNARGIYRAKRDFRKNPISSTHVVTDGGGDSGSATKWYVRTCCLFMCMCVRTCACVCVCVCVWIWAWPSESDLRRQSPLCAYSTVYTERDETVANCRPSQHNVQFVHTRYVRLITYDSIRCRYVFVFDNLTCIISACVRACVRVCVCMKLAWQQ